MGKEAEEENSIEVKLTKKYCDVDTLNNIIGVLTDFNSTFKPLLPTLVICARNPKTSASITVDGGKTGITKVQQKVKDVINIIAGVSKAVALGKDTDKQFESASKTKDQKSQLEEDLEKRNKELKTLRQQIKDLESIPKSTQNTNGRAAETSTATENVLEKQKLQHEQEINKIRDQKNSDLEATNNRLAESKTELKNKQEECNNLEKRLQEVQHELSQTNKEFQNLKQNMKNLESRPKSTQNKYDQPDKTGTTTDKVLQEHKKELEDANNRLDDANTKLNKKKEECEQIQINFQEAQDKVKLHEKSNHKLEQHIKDLESRLKSIQNKNNQPAETGKTTDHENVLEEEKVLLQEEIETLRAKHRQHINELEDKNNRLAEVQKKCQDLETKIQEANSKYEVDVKRQKSATAKNGQVKAQEIKVLEEKKVEYEKENVKLKEEIGKLNDKITQLNNEKKKLDEHMKAIKNNEEVDNLRKENKDLSVRLATEMNAKVSSDESSLENISIQCRPMNVADAYQNVCSNEWLDAKDFVSKKLDEEPSCILLRDIMLICESESAKLLDGIVRLEEYAIQEPVQHYSNLDGDQSDSKSKNIYTQAVKSNSPLKLTSSLQNEILDNYRLCVEKVDLQHLFKKCKERIAKQNSNFRAVHGKPVNDYIESVAKLAWKMVIQRPQMKFSKEGEGQKYRETSQELQWGSNPVGNSAKVKYYVYPLLYHGDKLMTKGKVFVV